MSVTIPQHLSFSSLSTFADCGEKYKLERLYHKSATTWFATCAGSAIHKMTELVELGEAQASDLSFQEMFDHYLEIERERGIEAKPSGRVGKTIGWAGGPNKRDYSWWLVYGPQIFQAFLDWRAANPHLELLTVTDPVTGEVFPGVEIPFYTDLGGVPIRGYIDRVFINTETDEVELVDYKTGSEPKSKLQLDTYGVALHRQYDVNAVWGGFAYPYFSKKEKAVVVGIPDGARKYLPTVSEEYVDYLYRIARNQIERGEFLPSPSTMCSGCSVKDFCRAKDGDDALSIPVWSEITVEETVDAAGTQDVVLRHESEEDE